MQRVAIDLETSGTDPEASGVLAIGLVQIGTIGRELLVFVDQREDRLTWTPEARTYFRRFEQEWRAGRVAPADAVETVQEWLRGVDPREAPQLVGHNICFDYRFLDGLFRREGRRLGRSVHHRLVDTHSILHFLAETGRIPAAAVSSDAAFHHFGIRVGASRHTALGDARATALLYERLLGEYGDGIS